jgi:hypothetical protein
MDEKRGSGRRYFVLETVRLKGRSWPQTVLLIYSLESNAVALAR